MEQVFYNSDRLSQVLYIKYKVSLKFSSYLPELFSSRCDVTGIVFYS